jgi:hypothetical protein
VLCHVLSETTTSVEVSTWRDFVVRGARWVLVGSRYMGRSLYYVSALVRPRKTLDCVYCSYPTVCSTSRGLGPPCMVH